jgi:hypothetical protein
MALQAKGIHTVPIPVKFAGNNPKNVDSYYSIIDFHPTKNN